MDLKELLDLVKSELKYLSTLDNPDFRLEQAEQQKDTNKWDLVISYLVENTNPKSSPLSGLTAEYKYHRIYKKIQIDEKKNIVGFYIYEH
uniref:hypothetical protein n=1 Tax=Flavobacterium sp. TaxID=239 RepID=UPI00404AFCCB